MQARMVGMFNKTDIGCQYFKREFQFSYSVEKIFTVDLVVTELRSVLVPKFNSVKRLSNVPILAFSLKSPAYPHHRWKSTINSFNGTIITYSPNSTIYRPYALPVPIANQEDKPILKN